MLLELDRVSSGYGRSPVLHKVSLAVGVGEIVALIGANGAGKSTLFNMIAGFLPPSGGRILFDGRDITSMKPWDRSRIGIGRTYQVPKPFTHMSVFENVLVAATHGGRMSLNRARGECDAVLESVGLIRRAETPAGQLALLDMKQLELAKALAVRPRLLLLDEIAGGLSEAETETLLTTIRQVHAGGVTIVWVEHVIQTLRRLVTKLVVLHGGGILASGPPEAVIANPRVKDAYLGN